MFATFKESKRRFFPDGLINQFLNDLLSQKDFWLSKELKESSKNDPTQPDYFYEENRILGALLKDLTVADVNMVWQPFGGCAIAEIQEERTKGYESKMYNEYTEDNLLWQYTTYQSIQFFYILINKAIEDKYTNSHFWLFYYDRIVASILKNIQANPPQNVTAKTTIYQKFIEEIIHRSFYWLEYANKEDHPGIYHNILDCIGTNLDQITKNPAYGEDKILSALDIFLNDYCRIVANNHSDDLIRKYEEKLLRPSMLTQNGDPYYYYFSEAWKKFDKIPHRAGPGNAVDLPYFGRLKQNVIIPLGLNPNAF